MDLNVRIECKKSWKFRFLRVNNLSKNFFENLIESSLKSANHLRSNFIIVYGLEVDEEPKVFRCCPELIKTENPEINFDVLSHNFCNHRRSMTNEKYHSVSFIILDRIDYLSRRTYRPLIEDQYKQLRPVFLDFLADFELTSNSHKLVTKALNSNCTSILDNNFMFVLGKLKLEPFFLGWFHFRWFNMSGV